MPEKNKLLGELQPQKTIKEKNQSLPLLRLLASRNEARPRAINHYGVLLHHETHENGAAHLIIFQDTTNYLHSHWADE